MACSLLCSAGQADQTKSSKGQRSMSSPTHQALRGPLIEAIWRPYENTLKVFWELFEGLMMLGGLLGHFGALSRAVGTCWSSADAAPPISLLVFLRFPHEHGYHHQGKSLGDARICSNRAPDRASSTAQEYIILECLTQSCEKKCACAKQ